LLSGNGPRTQYCKAAGIDDDDDDDDDDEEEEEEVLASCFGSQVCKVELCLCVKMA
jgi:hypothetical protein